MSATLPAVAWPEVSVHNSPPVLRHLGWDRPVPTRLTSWASIDSKEAHFPALEFPTFPTVSNSQSECRSPSTPGRNDFSACLIRWRTFYGSFSALRS